jgi:serine protease Do
VVEAKLDALKVVAGTGDIPQNVNFAVKSDVLMTFLDSNRAAYEVGTTSPRPLDPADLAEFAKGVSGHIACQ